MSPLRGSGLLGMHDLELSGGEQDQDDHNLFNMLA
jgi:hypothetical protein